MKASKSLFTHLVSGFAVLLMLVPAAKADTFYSYPFDKATRANAVWSIRDIHQQICADDFVIEGANAVIEELSFWLMLGDPVTVPSAFKVTFYESTANGYPASLIQETPWRTDVTCEDTGEDTIFGKVYKLTVTLSGSQQLAVSSDTRYWVGLQAQTSGGYVYSGMGTKIAGDMSCIWMGLSNQWVTTDDASPWGPSDVFFSVSGKTESALLNNTWGAIKYSL
jgi:hypothetical protein